MPIDASQCPICGNSNQCAIANNASATSCWCQKQNISPALIAQIKVSQRGKTCICQPCAIKAEQLSREIV